MSTASLETMSQVLTAPYSRGLEAVEVPVQAADDGGTVALGPYDFEDYRRRYGVLPQSPGYLLIPLFAPTAPFEASVSFRRTPHAVPESVVVQVPASRLPAQARAIPIGAPSSAALTLTSFHPGSDAPPGAPQENWRVVAVAGNLAKVLWILGAEHEELAEQARDVAAQRSRSSARGPSLDLLGADLGVPRFPPTAYSVDDETVALYHLDDEPGQGEAEPDTAFDEVERHRSGHGHPAKNDGQAAQSRQPGRFTHGFGFRPGSGAQLRAPDHPDFALPAAQGLTFEAMVSPAARKNAAIAGAVVGKRAVLNDRSQPGWGLAIGTFRAIDNNARLSVSDGAVDVTLFADSDLADGVFHHLAGTVERRGGGALVRFWLDGRPVAERHAPVLGALTSSAPLQIGLGKERAAGGGAAQDAALDGVVDEVRISRVARAEFHPAVGEGDLEYASRLGIFERWQLPTPVQLLAAVNGAVKLTDGGQTFDESFVLVEKDNAMVTATAALRVLPSALARGVGVTSDGRVGVAEAEAAGTPDDDPDFEPAWLVRHDSPRVVYPDDRQRLMQRALAMGLDALLARLGSAVTLRIRAGYDPRATGDLRSVGRALVVSAEGMDVQQLAGHAAAAGFDIVARTLDERVRLAQGRHEMLGIDARPAGATTPPPGTDLGVGDELSLSVAPALSPAAAVEWTLVSCGRGDAAFVDASGGLSRHALGPAATLRAAAPGALTVSVEANLRGKRAGGARSLRIGLPPSGPDALPAGAAIGGEGAVGITEDDATGGPAAFFHSVYLACDSAPGVDFGDKVLNRRMHRKAAAALDRMRKALPSGTLRVARAYDPAAKDLHGEGRALELSHSSQPGAALAAAAFSAGFDFVQRLPGDVIHVSVAAGELAELRGSPAATVPVGGSAPYHVAPQAQPSAVAFAPDGRTAYVANRDSSSVSAVPIPDGPLADLRVLQVREVALVDLHPDALVVNPDGKRLWTAGSESATLALLSTQPALTLVGSSTTGPGAVDLALRPDGSRICVACGGDSTLRVHDATFANQVASVGLPDVPVAVAVTPDSSQAWVACRTAVAVVNLQTNTLAGNAVSLPGAPSDLAISPDGKAAYVTLPGQKRLLPIDVATRAPGATIDVQCAATRVVASADGQLVWVASRDDGVARAVHASTGALDPVRVVLGSRPSAVAVRPAIGASRPAAVLFATSLDSQLALVDPGALGAGHSPLVLTARLGAGAGERLQWTVLPADLGDARLSSTVAPATDVVGARPGGLLVRAIYLHGGETDPYQMELRLRAELDHDGFDLRKDQYDIVMNVLNTLHPIGVEVRTASLRNRVAEIREGRADAFPNYTYPNFRTGSSRLTKPTRRS